MEPKFWHQRWETKRIGFHQPTTHDQLARHGARLAALTDRPRVLVPLCGKSLDMRHLRGLGYEVVGAELSPIAAREFFAEAGQMPTESAPCDRFVEYHADGITILCGDIFDITAERLGSIHAVYDRAALVALPKEMRVRYANLVTSLLSPGAPVLLVAFDYPQEEASGPPFSVPLNEVQSLFGDHFEIEPLASDNMREASDKTGQPPFVRSLSRAYEETYLLTRKECS